MADKDYYTKFKASIKYTTKGGLSMKAECENPIALFVETLQCTHKVLGEEKTRELFEKYLAAAVETQKRFEAQQLSKKEN